VGSRVGSGVSQRGDNEPRVGRANWLQPPSLQTVSAVLPHTALQLVGFHRLTKSAVDFTHRLESPRQAWLTGMADRRDCQA
jgi:hypothetical protein